MYPPAPLPSNSLQTNHPCPPVPPSSLLPLRIDTKTVETADGPRTYHFAVLGNPCENSEALNVPFVQPFGGRSTTLAREAREVRCEDGVLQGATMSDNGYVIISMFFDLPAAPPGDSVALDASASPLQPGRVTDFNGVPGQNEREYAGWCADREANGHDSGMGEIFRKVAEITPIVIPGRREHAGGSGGGNSSKPPSPADDL